MSHKFTDVHTFDGKLKDIFKPSRTYQNDEKKKEFTKLINVLDNQEAISTVQTMITDMICKEGNNFQSENNIDSSDVLMELIQISDNPDVLKGLNEQLADARNLGICPSGRVTRLLQLWSAFIYENNDNRK